MSFVTLKWFLEAPTQPGFSLLWINLVLLAHASHESALFFAISLAILLVYGAVLIVTRRVKFKPPRLSYLYFMTPIFLVPLLWQKWIQVMGSNPFEKNPEIPAFAWIHLVKHTEAFLRTLYSFDFYVPHAALLN